MEGEDRRGVLKGEGEAVNGEESRSREAEMGAKAHSQLDLFPAFWDASPRRSNELLR